MATEAALLYRGSVKDVLGPVQVKGRPAVVFDYSDAFSVFDWGKMPDPLPRKGEALAILAAHLFEQLERPETWKEFSRTPEALGLRKGNRFGSGFNELGERLQAEGLRTHYLGMAASAASVESPQALSEVAHVVSNAGNSNAGNSNAGNSNAGNSNAAPGAQGATKTALKRVIVKQVHVVRPRLAQVLGRQVPDYTVTHASPLPRLVPCEVVFRFNCPAGSSLLERVARDPGYLASRGFGTAAADSEALAGAKWDFPVLEMFTKLESSDRPLTLSEGLSVSGISAERLQELLWLTAWVAGWLRSTCSKAGLELADGKLEWGLGEDGRLMLVDAIGPDELRILKDGVQLSKEFLRKHYRETSWYAAVNEAKEKAEVTGQSDWKRGVAKATPKLPDGHRDAASQVYLSLTNHLTGRNWFPEAWGLERVVSRLKEIAG